MAVPKLRYPEFQGEWDKITLGDKLSFKNGVNASRNAFRSDGYKCIGVSDVYKCLPITDEAIIGTVALTQKEAERYIVNNGDLLFQRSSETQEDIGHVSTYIGNGNVVFNGFVICGKPLEPFYDPVFMHYELQTSRVRSETVRLGAGAQHYNIGQESLSKITAYVPTIIEQQKIADFLSTVDDMRRIFSREIRFKREDGTEFPEWENITFSELFLPLNNNTFSRDMLNYECGEVKNIHYGDILVKFIEICKISTDTIPFVNNSENTSRFSLLQSGDIVLADTAEDETVGKAIEIFNPDTIPVISGLHTMACRPQIKFAMGYLGYYINSEDFHKQLIPFMQGIKVTSIGRKNIANTVIRYPANLEEQQKIADFLSEYYTAIQAAKDELAKWQEMKKGLLQQMFV